MQPKGPKSMSKLSKTCKIDYGEWFESSQHVSSLHLGICLIVSQTLEDLRVPKRSLKHLKGKETKPGKFLKWCFIARVALVLKIFEVETYYTLFPFLFRTNSQGSTKQCAKLCRLRNESCTVAWRECEMWVSAQRPSLVSTPSTAQPISPGPISRTEAGQGP